MRWGRAIQEPDLGKGIHSFGVGSLRDLVYLCRRGSLRGYLQVCKYNMMQTA